MVFAGRDGRTDAAQCAVAVDHRDVSRSSARRRRLRQPTPRFIRAVSCRDSATDRRDRRGSRPAPVQGEAVTLSRVWRRHFPMLTERRSCDEDQDPGQGRAEHDGRRQLRTTSIGPGPRRSRDMRPFPFPTSQKVRVCDEDQDPDQGRAIHDLHPRLSPRIRAAMGQVIREESLFHRGSRPRAIPAGSPESPVVARDRPDCRRGEFVRY